MSGASIIIALSQVKYILGIKIPRTDTLQSGLEEIFNNIGACAAARSGLPAPRRRRPGCPVLRPPAHSRPDLPLPAPACPSVGRAGKFQWREFCMGMAFIFILLAFQYLSRTYK